MIQFFSAEIRTNPVLDPQESVHCIRVLRKKRGDMVRVTDGKGKIFECEIIDDSSRKVELAILSERNEKKNWSQDITLAIAPTKNSDRMSWVVEKAVEIGVDNILFFPSRHCERKTVNIERLRRNAISAMNQSLKSYLPNVKMLDKFDALTALRGKKFFGYCDEVISRRNFIDEYRGKEDIVIAIGPEGDFSEEEVLELIKGGYQAVTFGKERLRTETAALYGIVAVHILTNLN